MQEGAQLLTSNLMRAADLLYSFKQVAADQAIEDRRALNLADWIDAHTAFPNSMVDRITPATPPNSAMRCRRAPA